MTNTALPNQMVRSSQLDWKPLEEPGVSGIFVKVLRFDESSGRAPTFLLKFDPGASYPAHDHPGGEEGYVLEGSIHIGEVHLHAGDYLYTAPGNTHAVHSDEGCIALFSIPEEVVKL